MATSEARRTLTIPEFAREIGIGQTLTRKMIRDGRLPVVRCGTRVLISRETLESMLATDAGESDPASTAA